jgi:TetR/AcrR family transcriptional repressor of mexJK operon
MSGAGGRPTKAQAAGRTAALLDAARQLFCERGYAAATIDELAARLRWSKHTVYHRYASKLDLLEAVVDRDVERFVEAMTSARATSTEETAALKAMARTYFAFSASREYSALYAAIALEAASSTHLREKLACWIDMSLTPLRQGVIAAAPARDWQEDRAEQICAVLIDLLDGEGNRMKWSNTPVDLKVVEQHFNIRWHIFLAASHAFNTLRG